MKLPSFLSLWSPLQLFDWLICKWGFSLKSTSPRCVHKINVLILIAFSFVFINIFGLVWFITFYQTMLILRHHRILLHTFSPCLIIYIWQLNDKYEKLIGKPFALAILRESCMVYWAKIMSKSILSWLIYHFLNVKESLCRHIHFEYIIKYMYSRY